MTQIKSTPITKERFTNRIIGKIQGGKGPTIVFFAGIHGNETAGVLALTKMFKNVTKKDVNGTIYGIKGNLKALEKKLRYLDEDLNRIWTSARLRNISHKANLNSEEKEQKELYTLLKSIIDNNSGPFYFIDFHTTSSKTEPFITINDSIINRKFSKMFPVPIVLGIEEYLNGALLSYINELGYVSLGFESGQHEEKQAIANCLSFIYLTLHFSNVIADKKDTSFLKHFNNLRTVSKNLNTFFEIIFLHSIQKGEDFKMKAGFKSFEDIKKKTLLATCNNKPILSKHNAKIFMPLYQAKGKEGYFIIKQIPYFFLKLSTVLRKAKVDNLLALLPGVFWETDTKNVLVVNLKIARFFAKSFFHLLGYRNKQADKTYVKLYNRERTSKTKMYEDQFWYKKTT